MNNPVMHGIQEKGIWAKAHKLFRRFEGVIYSTYNQDVLNDYYQEIVLAIAEAVVKDPEILEQKPGYLLQLAEWRVSNKMRSRKKTYYRDIDEINVDGDWFEKRGAAVASDTAADYDTSITVRQVVATLSEYDRQVAQMLMQGYSKSEIARHLEVTPPAISYRVGKLRSALAAAL